jgi:large subunit ribosomal protein L21
MARRRRVLFRVSACGETERFWYDQSGDLRSMYAIVKTGGKQYKVAVGDVVEVEKIAAKPGDNVDLPALLLVDGEDVTTDADALAKVTVTGEIVAHTKGPKIKIHHFKSKTGYHRRMGHRQPLTALKVTGIENGK